MASEGKGEKEEGGPLCRSEPWLQTLAEANADCNENLKNMSVECVQNENADEDRCRESVRQR